MRYPVGKSNDDFLKNWYDAQSFGVKTSYGYHEGHDYNLKTGGNTDLGQPLIAVADGKIVYYHNDSHPNSNFGRHMVLECETERGKRWYHYCHCQEITAQVKEVKEGEVIGKLGTSGTTLAHLHFSVFKVDPKSLTKGIDSIATSLSQLNNWEKFELLSTQSPMQEIILKKYNVKDEQELDQKIEEHVGTTWGGEENGGFLGSARKKIRELEAKIDSLSVSLSDSRDKHALFVSRIIDKLNPFLGLPNASDEEKAMEAIEKMISENSSLVSELKSSQKKWSERETALLDENRQLHSELDRLKEEIELMEKKHSDDILELKKRLENAQQSIDAHNEDKADFELFKGLWNKVKELLRIK